MSVRNDSNHFGNNIPCFPNQNRVAYGNLFFIDKRLVMQNRPTDSGARKTNRLKYRCRRQHAGTADFDLNIQQYGRLLFRRIFVSNRPFGIFGCTSQLLSLRKAIHLNNCPVNTKRVVFPILSDPLDFLHHRFNGGKSLIRWRNRKTQTLEKIQRFFVSG